jgi:hypothetical protein
MAVKSYFHAMKDTRSGNQAKKAPMMMGMASSLFLYARKAIRAIPNIGSIILVNKSTLSEPFIPPTLYPGTCCQSSGEQDLKHNGTLKLGND